MSDSLLRRYWFKRTTKNCSPVLKSCSVLDIVKMKSASITWRQLHFPLALGYCWQPAGSQRSARAGWYLHADAQSLLSASFQREEVYRSAFGNERAGGNCPYFDLSPRTKHRCLSVYPVGEGLYAHLIKFPCLLAASFVSAGAFLKDHQQQKDSLRLDG